jgi:isopenicillin N synthase-like dioxygenase
MSMSTQDAMLSVPVIDIGTLMACETDGEVQAKHDDKSLDPALHALRAAAAEWGFFYITSHGMSETELDEFRSFMAAFFALPLEVKNQVRRTEGNPHGYFDSELTKNKKDWKEVFDYSCKGAKRCSDESFKALRELRVRWPPDEALPGFRRNMTEYFDKMMHLSRRIVMLFSLALGKEATFLDRYYKDAKGEDADTNVQRLNYYPVSPEPEKTMGVYHHTDAGAVTVLLQDDNVASLQVFHRGAKEWVNVPPRKNTFVINIGDMVQIWSNDRFQAPLHRVLSNGEKDRYSAPFFSHPAMVANIEPILMDEQEKPKYRPVNWFEFILKRAQGNYADLGEEVQIDQYRI